MRCVLSHNFAVAFLHQDLVALSLLTTFEQLSRQLLPPPGGQSVPTVVTTFAFDTSQELLWAGNGYVRSLGTADSSFSSFDLTMQYRAALLRSMQTTYKNIPPSSPTHIPRVRCTNCYSMKKVLSPWAPGASIWPYGGVHRSGHT